MNAEVEIRPAGDEDAASVAEVWLAGWHDAHDGLVPRELVDAWFLDDARVGERTISVPCHRYAREL